MELSLAWRYLSNNKRNLPLISYLAITGVSLGVAVLIIVMSVMNGFHNQLLHNILGIGSHIDVYSTKNKIIDYPKLTKEISKLENIQSISPIIETPAMLQYLNQVEGIVVKSTPFENLINDYKINDLIKSGDSDLLKKNKGVLLGKYLAKQLMITPKQKLYIISPKTNKTIIGSIPKSKSYSVSGIFSTDMYEYDRYSVWLPFSMAQKQFNLYNSVNKIEIKLNDPELDLEAAITGIKKIIGQNPELYLNNWKIRNKHFFEALQTEKVVMKAILTLIIAIASFSILATVSILVTNKAESIAILRTIGMSKYAVMRIFTYCGIIIGFIGASIGIILGSLIAYNIQNLRELLESITNVNLFNPIIYFLSILPSSLNFSEILYTFCISILLAFLAAILPAYKAAKQLPSSILR